MIKKINIKVNINYESIIKIVYGLLIFSFMFGIYWLYGFLNSNIFQIITQSERIIVLKNEIQTEVVEILAFEKIVEHLDNKQKNSTQDISKIKNMFYDIQKEPEPAIELEAIIKIDKQADVAPVPQEGQIETVEVSTEENISADKKITTDESIVTTP